MSRSVYSQVLWDSSTVFQRPRSVSPHRERRVLPDMSLGHQTHTFPMDDPFALTFLTSCPFLCPLRRAWSISEGARTTVEFQKQITNSSLSLDHREGTWKAADEIQAERHTGLWKTVKSMESKFYSNLSLPSQMCGLVSVLCLKLQLWYFILWTAFQEEMFVCTIPGT